jgi:hypothetical protein
VWTNGTGWRALNLKYTHTPIQLYDFQYVTVDATLYLGYVEETGVMGLAALASKSLETHSLNVTGLYMVADMTLIGNRYIYLAGAVGDGFMFVVWDYRNKSWATHKFFEITMSMYAIEY